MEVIPEACCLFKISSIEFISTELRQGLSLFVLCTAEPETLGQKHVLRQPQAQFKIQPCHSGTQSRHNPLLSLHFQVNTVSS